MKTAKRALTTGLLFGVGGVYLALVGLLLMMQERPIVFGYLNLGHAVLLVLGLASGAVAARAGRREAGRLGAGLLAGVTTGALMAALQVVVAKVPLQGMFIAASPALRSMLAFGFATVPGALAMLLAGAASGLAGAILATSVPSLRRQVIAGGSAVVIAGVFQQLIQLVIQYGGIIGAIRNFLYTWQGLRPEGAIAILVVAAAASEATFRLRRRDDVPGPAERRRRRFISAGVALLILVLLPVLAGAYIGEVLMLVGLYILMGMGLNLEVGLAGLLDLGFVAFFAVGAYATALLTSGSSIGLLHLSFWEAIPLSVLISVVGGVLFGLPVLGVRGDYLAVATLGLGEIVRIVVLSDFAAPLLGGPQGVLEIPKPSIGHFVLGSPVELFYLTLVCAGIAAFIAWRLENSRLGRAWEALRDDEDVAQALGVNLIRSKLLAYGLGAAFAGLGGSIFAAMLGSVYPSSFQLLISINVLALIIVGGMGSLPGVMLGAIALIGLPELLREFGEYRYLFYGAALIVMMRWKPEGLWPSEVRSRELHAAAGEPEGLTAAELR
ncbi:MAG: branched-chain amino acid ABC transporter permease [Acetobacteraceae bacterium]